MTFSPVNRELRALIIEDSEDDTLLLVDHLGSAGFSLDYRRVDTTDDLVDALTSSRWDIAFSDYKMPRLSGDQALAIIRRHDRDVPFIFVSGTIGEETAVAAMKAGAQDFVMKDNLARLMPAVERELSEANQRRERRRAQSVLRKLSLAVHQTADTVCITDRQGNIEYVNPAFQRLTGFRASEVRGQPLNMFALPATEPDVFAELWRHVNAGRTYRGTLTSRHKGGELFYEEKTVSPLSNNGDITHFVFTGRDVTDRVRADQAHARLVAILEATTDLVMIADADGSLTYMNEAARHFTGVDTDTATGPGRLDDCFSSASAGQLQTTVLEDIDEGDTWSGELTMLGSDGNELPVSLVALGHRHHGRLVFYSVIARDISERKAFEEELRHRATHDTLTNLPDRLLMAERLAIELHRSQREQTLTAVIFLDFDNFKRVNDTLGHAAGDQLLIAVTERLHANLRSEDTLARHGGDEFAVVAAGMHSQDDVLSVLRKLRRAFDESVTVLDQEIFVSFCAGIAIYPGDGCDYTTLLKNADTAMYRAKARGANQYQFYAPEMNSRSHEMLALETDLRRALQREEFRLHFQPQYDLERDRVVAFEALLRWQHPTLGTISPAAFIPLLEQTGQIVDVGEWVLEESCALHRQLRNNGGEPPRIAINLSPRQFNDVKLVDRIRHVLTSHDMAPDQLEIEITEHTLMQDVDSSAEVMAALTNLGVRLAVDDFGTGYSSLSYLKRLPLSALKIDGSFIRDLPQDNNDSAIVEATIPMAHKLGLEVIAECVETRQQLDFLKSRQCDLAQGYLLGYPEPVGSLKHH